MKVVLEERLAGGAFADVWRATDELKRKVAVKIVRPSAANIADALTHARALARTNHDNVVRVHSIERVKDPATGEVLDAVVMELLEGDDLSRRLAGPSFERDELLSVGKGIVAGVEHIHGLGLAHGDLHEGNVMLCPGGPKIIDILYLNTLSELSTASRETRIARDLVSLRLLLTQLIAHSVLDPAEATEFNNLLGSSASLEEIKSAFGQVTDPKVTDQAERLADHAYRRVIDDGFVPGPSYAAALLDDTPQPVSAKVLSLIVKASVFRDEHSDYVTALWARCSEVERNEIGALVASKVDDEVPRGRWWPHLKMLQHIGLDLWNRMPKVASLRLENAMINDVLGGYEDIWKVTSKKGGYLAAYASDLYPGFTEVGKLAQNIISMLLQSWYTQNYIAKFFMSALPGIAKAANMEDKMIAALAAAIRNDAKLVVSKRSLLPPEWVSRLPKPDEEAEKE